MPWEITGNSGTSGTQHFLGTTDAQTFSIRVNGKRALRIEPATTPNLIGGYEGNEVAASVIGATIGGGGADGSPNRIEASFGTIAGGRGNLISGESATVGGGENNSAAGTYSFAAGRRAKANHAGTFVWADAQTADFGSTADNQFLVQAVGGVGIGTASPQEQLDINGRVKTGALTIGAWPPDASYMFVGVNTLDQHNQGNYALKQTATGASQGDTFLNSPTAIHFRIANSEKMSVNANGNVSIVAPTDLHFGNATRQMINLYSTSYGIGVQNRTQYYRTGNGFAWFVGGKHSDTQADPGAGGATLMTLNKIGELSVNAVYFGKLTRQMINLYSTSYGIGIQNRTQYFRTNGGFAWFLGGKHSDAQNDHGQGGTTLMTLSKTGDFAISGDKAIKVGGGAWAGSSDRRLKQNVRPLEGALDKVLQLRGVSFEWKEPEKQGNLSGPQMGMIAQEVEEVFPEWISTDSKGFKILSIRGFEALVVEALRALKRENEELKAQINFLRTGLLA